MDTCHMVSSGHHLNIEISTNQVTQKTRLNKPNELLVLCFGLSNLKCLHDNQNAGSLYSVSFWRGSYDGWLVYLDRNVKELNVTLLVLCVKYLQVDPASNLSEISTFSLIKRYKCNACRLMQLQQKCVHSLIFIQPNC